MANKITVTSLGTTANVNATPDSARYYSDKSKEWAIGEKLIDNTDYSSKYYANESKKQADISTAKTAEVVESGNTAVSNIENARDNAILDVNTAGATQVANVNSAGTTQINLAKEQVTLATNQANIATEQATIATNKTSEVVASGNEALSNIDTAKTGALTDITNLKNTSVSNITTAKNNAITSITTQETTSKTSLIDEGATQIGLIQNEGAIQVNLATEQATIATTQAGIATSKTAEVVESGNTALSSIETAKSNALNDINTTGAEYVNNAEQYAQNALNSANNAKTSEDNALSYKNSAIESSQIATEQASIATTNANKAITSANNAKTSETNAKSSETRCEEILSRLGTAIKIKGRVNSLGDLPLSGNLDGDTYLVGSEGLDSYPEYYWYQDHWEFLGTSGTTLSWGLITGNIKAQTDLQTELDTKQDVISDLETIRSNANLVTTKQDTIPDLATIRSGASKGATALQSIPAEYVTETELNAKGYLTSYTETDPIYTADKPNIALKSEMPTKTSQLTNDSDYITSSYHDSTKQDKLTAGDNIAIIDNVISAKGGGGLELCDIGMSLYIDETKGLRRYLNGQIVDINTNTQAFLNRLQEITTLHPSLLCTEEEWQAAKTMSAFGQVGKFVFNYNGAEIVSVRIPRVVNVQGLFDLQNLGMTVAAGLPNITGSITGKRLFGQYASSMRSAGALKLSTTSSSSAYSPTNPGQFNNGFIFDASDSNPIYGNSTTVQQEAIQYPYFIQIATGSETENNIINEIELNNPYSLFDSKYSDHELNNLSWLKSEGQWNAKSVYPTAYDKLLKVYNGTETVVGLSVKLSTEEYTDYDFVLNTADETFRLPLLNGDEHIADYTNSTTIGNNVDFIVPQNGFIRNFVTNTSGTSYASVNGVAIIEHCSNASVYNDSDIVKVSKGDIYHSYFTSDSSVFYKAKGNGSLYYYVGETVQNANLIDAGRIGEQLANKQDKLIRYPIEISDKSLMPSWYVVYSDGWCEQGITLELSASANNTITLLKPYKDMSYQVLIRQDFIETGNVVVLQTKKMTEQTINANLKHAVNNTYFSRSCDFYTYGYIR